MFTEIIHSDRICFVVFFLVEKFTNNENDSETTQRKTLPPSKQTSMHGIMDVPFHAYMILSAVYGHKKKNNKKSVMYAIYEIKGQKIHFNPLISCRKSVISTLFDICYK